MDNWISIKILSDLLGAGNHVAVKGMLLQQPKHDVNLLCVMLVSLPFAIVGLLNLGQFTLSHILVSVVIGCLYILSGHFYYLGMAHIQSTTVSMVSRLGSIFTLLLSVLILNEVLTLLQILGFILAFVGGITLVGQEIEGLENNKKGIRYALASTLLGSLCSTLTAHLLQHHTLWQTFTITRVGVIIGILGLMGLGGLWRTLLVLYQMCNKFRVYLIVEQLVRLATLYLNTKAISAVGSPSIASVLSGFSPLYVWVLEVIVKREPIQIITVKARLWPFLLLIGSVMLLKRNN